MMIAKLQEALALFRQHIVLFTVIILTISLPTNTLIGLLRAGTEPPEPMNLVRISAWSQIIFGPIWLGALTYALARIKTGNSIAYAETIAHGVKTWGALFVARLLAGLLIALGLLAFVVPGVILAVRYSLIVPVVVLEENGPLASRARSTHLTVGRRREILGAVLLFFVAWAALALVVYLPLGLVESVFLGVVLDCLMDVTFGVLYVVLFLFYWDAVTEERLAAASGEPEDIVPSASGP